MKRTNSLTPSTFDLTIDSLSYHGGRGVGRHEGVVVFVPGAAPGDHVRVRVTARKSNLIEAELISVLSPSPHRRTPPCPVAGRCGGCSWQHVTYEEQLVQKEKILRDSLRRLERTQSFTWAPFVPAPREFFYRNRIQVQIQNGRRGFFAPRTRELVEFDQCWITEPALNEELRRLRPADFAGVKKVELALTEAGELRVMAGERDPAAALFSQVNTAQNEMLKTLVGDGVEGEAEWFLDLYAGAGNLTSPLRARLPGAFGRAVEFSQASVARGRSNHPSVEWTAGDVGVALAGLKPRDGRGVILLDPPRVGADQRAITGVLAHKATQILYVSCNPATFARDAERLIGAGHYRLAQVRGLDMFPQTEHVELIASFVRTN